MGLMLIVWLASGILAAIVFQNKGRSWIGGFALGFLMGPLGLVIALVLSKNEAGVEAKAIVGGEHRKCPFCADLIRSEAVRCRHCGSDVAPVAKAA